MLIILFLRRLLETEQMLMEQVIHHLTITDNLDTKTESNEVTPKNLGVTP